MIFVSTPYFASLLFPHLHIGLTQDWQPSGKCTLQWWLLVQALVVLAASAVLVAQNLPAWRGDEAAQAKLTTADSGARGRWASRGRDEVDAWTLFMANCFTMTRSCLQKPHNSLL